MDKNVSKADLKVNKNRLAERKIKVCPVVLREVWSSQEILVFRHPQAGVQLIKGTLEAGESIPECALRELNEESGICHVNNCKYLGVWESLYENQQWHFVLCEVNRLPESWSHITEDDGGHKFEFFWHSLHCPPTDDWHKVFSDALSEIRRAYMIHTPIFLDNE